MSYQTGYPINYPAAPLPPVAGLQLVPVVADAHTHPDVFGLQGAIPSDFDIIPKPLRTALWLAGFASSIGLTYHGYKRNDSVGWALVWGIFGGLVWPITVPIAIGQGFGKHKK